MQMLGEGRGGKSQRRGKWGVEKVKELAGEAKQPRRGHSPC